MKTRAADIAIPESNMDVIEVAASNVQRTLLDERRERLLASLAHSYGALVPRHADRFVSRVFVRLNKFSLRSAGALVNPDQRVNHAALKGLCSMEGLPMPEELWAIYVACAFEVESRRAEERKEFDVAWDLFSMANLWCGVSLATQEGELFAESLTNRIVRARNRHAAQEKASKSQPRREKVWGLARTLKPEGEKWSTDSKAISTITLNLLDDVSEATLRRDLAKMPDRELHFNRASGALDGTDSAAP